MTRRDLEKLADPYVTFALIGVCLAGLAVAAFGPLWAKGLMLGWFLFP